MKLNSIDTGPETRTMNASRVMLASGETVEQKIGEIDSTMVSTDTDQNITGVKTFGAPPKGPDPIEADDLAPKSYTDALRTDLADPDLGADLVSYLEDETVDDALRKTYTGPIFGRSGMRITVGVKNDAHYGWGGIVAFPSGKWTEIYRKGVHHGVRDYSELRAMDSYDKGQTWVNDRLVCPTGDYDLRPDPPRMMANGRAGFLVNRQSESPGHKSPWFIYSDDEGLTFTVQEITTASPYTFSGTQALIEWPTSQGGDDVQGFAAYGYLNAGGVDMLATADNGATWQQIFDVADPQGLIGAISESSVVRLGNTDRWIIFSRARVIGGGAWKKIMTVWLTTDMQDWGVPKESGLELDGSPPCGIYDQGSVWLLNPARGGRSIDGFEQNIMMAVADAEALWTANGDFTTIGVSYTPLACLPSWTTGYLAPFRDDGRWYTTLTCGEDGINGGATGFQVLVGDFTPTSTDLSLIVQALLRRQKCVGSIEIDVADNLATTWGLRIRNAAKTVAVTYGPYGVKGVTGGASYTVEFDNPVLYSGRFVYGMATPITGANAYLHVGVTGSDRSGIVTGSMGTSSLRKHLTPYNSNGELGGITTNGTTTSYGTTSDETYKLFLREYPAAEAARVILDDPVREWEWTAGRGGGRAIGWGAQTSYAISQDLATKGGWKMPHSDADFQEGDFAWIDPVNNTEWVEGGVRFEDVETTDVNGNPVTVTAKIEAVRVEATYVPWTMDQSKRTPYLWAATAWLIQEQQAMREELNELKARLADLL